MIAVEVVTALVAAVETAVESRDLAEMLVADVKVEVVVMHILIAEVGREAGKAAAGESSVEKAEVVVLEEETLGFDRSFADRKAVVVEELEELEADSSSAHHPSMEQ